MDGLMLLPILLILPIAGALLAVVVRPYRPGVAIASVWIAGLECATSLAIARACLARETPVFGPGDFLRADGLSAVLVLTISGVTLVSLWFGVGYLHDEKAREHLDGALIRRYYMLTHLFVFTMLLAVTANNVGVMWIAVEATTITSAFLVGLQQSKSSLEASWKYILIGSVGIALAFVGTVLGYFNFVQRVGHLEYALHWTVLCQVAERLNGDVLKLCFVFIVIGYGTKAGLAPMYTWLPDAHSEAPAPISSIMSGSLLAVALYAILRWKVVVDARLGSTYSNRVLILMGTLSVAVAAVLLIRQTSYKRMLAYSSVEHMGLMCLGFGLGPLGTFAALLHLMNHAAAKSMMFLLSGSVLHRYGSTRISAVKGLLQALPWTGGLFLAGGLALLGMPPFGIFVSEMLLFRAGFLSGHPWIAGLVALLLVMIFISFLGYINKMLYGTPPAEESHGGPSGPNLFPLALNVAALLVLGLMIPEPVARLLRQVVEIVNR
jgi:hydrogenase-4 component F